MQVGPSSFRLRYKEAEIEDRNPKPPEPTSGPLEASAEVAIEADFSVSAWVTRGLPYYPPPPASGSVDPDDDCVVKMKGRYELYCLGRTTLPDAENFCVTILEKQYGGGRSAAAKKCGISNSVLDTIGRLASTKGGAVARKAIGADDEFTNQEKRFLNLAIPKIIFRAAQVAADDSQRHPQSTMKDLPKL